MAPSLFPFLHRRHPRTPISTCNGATASGERCSTRVETCAEVLLDGLRKEPTKAGPALAGSLQSISTQLFCAEHVDQAPATVQSWMGGEAAQLEQDEEQAHEAAIKLSGDLSSEQHQQQQQGRRVSRFIERLDEEVATHRFPSAFEYEALEAAALGEIPVTFGAQVMRPEDTPSLQLQRRATIGSGSESETTGNRDGRLKRGGENRRRTFPSSARERLERSKVLEERVRRELERDGEHQGVLERIGRLSEEGAVFERNGFADVDVETSLLGEEDGDREGSLVLARVHGREEDGRLSKVWSRTERGRGREKRRRVGRYEEGRARRWCRNVRELLRRE